MSIHGESEIMENWKDGNGITNINAKLFAKKFV
jgi:hypothetical protein